METEAQRKARLQKTKAKFAELSAADAATRVAGITGRAIARDAISAIPDFAAGIGNLGLLGANKLTGNQNIQPNIPYVSDYLEKGFDYLTDDQFVPKTLSEKMLDRGAGFVAGAGGLNQGVKALAKGGVKLGDRLSRFLTTKGAKEYAATAGAGAGLEYGKDISAEGDVVAPILGSLLGGYAGGKVAGGARAIANPRQTLAQSLGINPEKAQAFKEAGLTPTLSNISDSNIVGMSENLLRNTPFAADAIQDSIKATQDKIGKYDFGIGRNKAGTIAQEGLTKWREKGFKIADKLQKNVEKYVEPYMPIKLNNTLDFISKKPSPYTNVAKGIVDSSVSSKKFAQIEEALEQVKNAAEQNLKQFYGGEKNALGDPEFIKQFGHIADSIESLKNGDVLPYLDTVVIRKHIDDLTNGKYGNIELGENDVRILKELRKELQKDISDTLEQISPQAAKANQRFNNYYKQFADKNDKKVAKLLESGKFKKTPTETFKDIISNTNVDAEKAKTVFSTLKPEQKENFTKSIITELGSNPQNEFNSSTLATKFKKLDKEAQDIALTGLSPEEKKTFKATIKSIDAIKNTMSTANNSKTAYTSGLAATGKDVITNPIKTSLILATGALTSSGFFTNPNFLNWLSKAQKITDPKKLEKSLGALDRLAKESPQFAPDIIQYKTKLNELQNDEELRNDTMQWDQEEFEKLNAKYGNNDNVNLEQPQQQLGEVNEGMEVSPNELSSNPQELPNEPEWDQEEWERLNAKYGNESNKAIDDTLIDKIAQVESGGNPNAKAKTSTASGLLQFTDGTWRNGVQKYGNELGITLKDKANPEAQKALAAKMLEENAQNLQTFLNREPTEGELYLTHFLGLEGAKKLLKSDPSQLAARLFPAAAKANKAIFFKGGKALTNRQLIAMLEDKITKA